MAVVEDVLAFQARLRLTLQNAANPISYGALARDLDVPGPGAIARIAAALEAMMQEDMASGRPFLAAMCQGKLSGGMPALGFFQMASALGRYDGPATGLKAAAFVEEQRDLLAHMANGH